MLFDLNLIKPFLAVYHQLSYSKAAELIGLSQPATSRAIHRLEDTLGYKLFVKKGRGITPTNKAVMLANDFESAINIIENSVDTKKQFIIYCHEGLLFHLNGLPIKFLSPPSSQSKMIEDLRADKADLAIDHVTDNDPSFVIETLGETEMVAVTSKHNQISKFDEETFYSLQHVLTKSTRHGMSFFDLLVESPRPRHEKYIADSAMTMLTYVSIDHSTICVAPRIIVDMWKEALNLKTFTIPFEIQKAPYQLIYHRRYEHNEEHKKLREEIKARIPKH
ncbi:LysR family transcriptional regulator [Thalassotalea sp. PLHSN55]|uniref:LysR family transcriptional regulator n=1 Tax=Thalassotalea sp. PLHSN55 TaxID=3435888 RepID=UPI003F828895